MPGRALGPGGQVNRDEDEFFYWEKEGRGLVLKAAKPTGESRVLRAFDEPEESFAVAVQGRKVAFVTLEDGETSVNIAEAGGEEAETILTVDGFLDVLAWSPDGRWLAATHWPGDGTGARAMLIAVAPDGRVQGEPRSLGPSADSWWGHQWLPDSSGFLTAGTEGNVWFMPLDPMADPVPITQEEEGAISDFVLSPDGTQIAYAPWIPEGNSLWLIDLGDALTGISR
jgi:Tol biopolymer transport system component